MNLLLKPFDEMTEADYAQLGLKAGLEIHQQLFTEKKLFCRCYAGHYTEEYDAEILRHMRPTLSELGEYDGTALMEFKTKKDIIYQINHETVCTYEMDDTPPFEINQQALDIALEIAMLMNYKMVSEIHIARKQYLDGSIPTGFQRTTIVGIDGAIPYKGREIGLIQLGLEEDSCREVSDIGHERVYRSDRLGMPLIETVTQPQMKTPQEVADVANILRWLVRSTGKVRTGIGAARQDVNVSIKGGTRIEIKGVPRIPAIPRLVYNEALRQYSLLQIRAELKKRGITEKTFEAESADVTRYLRNTEWDPIRRALKHNWQIHCVNLKGFSGILSYPTQAGKVFSKEISDRVRVIACLTRLPNILTSESTEEAIDSLAGNRVRKAVNATSRDGLVLVWGSEADVKTAVQEIIIRAKEATMGIPSETRQALADGTNGFERILPGPERMYPDTDLPPLEITKERLDQLAKNLPEPVWDRISKYRKMKVPEHLIIPIASTPQAKFYEEMVEKHHFSPARLAHILFEKTKEWKRAGMNVQKLTPQVWDTILSQADDHPVLMEAVNDICKKIMTGHLTLEQILSEYLESDADELQIPEIFNKIEQNGLPEFDDVDKKRRYLTGEILEQVRGIVPAGAVIRFLLQSVK